MAALTLAGSFAAAMLQRVATNSSRREAFARDAGPRLPGLLVALNLADFKRRNAHLGHALGDADLAAVERLLAALTPPEGCWARVGGDAWRWLLPPSCDGLLRALREGIARAEPGVVGFEVRAVGGEARAVKREEAATCFLRAVRCLVAPVATRAELDGALARMDEEDYALPVGEAHELAALAALPRVPFRSVLEVPLASPTCALCGGAVAWGEGDGSVFGGAGRCSRCAAELEVRDVSRRSEPRPWGPPPAHARQERSWVQHLAPAPLGVLTPARVEVLEWWGERALVSRFHVGVPPGLPALAHRPGWDLPLLGLEADDEGEAQRPLVLELLPDGVPSTWLPAAAATPAFVLEVLERFSAAHRRGELVGEVHPSLLFVNERGELAGCAQRPLRVEDALLAAVPPTASGGRAVVQARLLTPAQVRSAPSPGPHEDVFRLGGLLWWWRHRAPPFGFELLEWVMRTLRGEPVRAPSDELDELLASALCADEARRPSLDALVAATRAAGTGWGVTPSSSAPAR